MNTKVTMFAAARWPLRLLLALAAGAGPLASAQTAAAEGPAGQVVRYTNTDFQGSDIGSGAADSFEQCAARCVAEPRCAAFTLSPGRTCSLKTDAMRVLPAAGADSGYLAGRGTPPVPVAAPQPPVVVAQAMPQIAGPFVLHDNTDFPTNDLRELVVPVRAVDECAARCLALPQCVGFSFNKSSRQCNGKTALGAGAPNPYMISGVRSGGNVFVLPPGGGAVATPNACSVGGVGRCPGCSVACAAGERPVCSAPVEGVAGMCQRDASCRCTSN